MVGSNLSKIAITLNLVHKGSNSSHYADLVYLKNILIAKKRGLIHDFKRKLWFLW